MYCVTSEGDLEFDTVRCSTWVSLCFTCKHILAFRNLSGTNTLAYYARLLCKKWFNNIKT